MKANSAHFEFTKSKKPDQVRNKSTGTIEASKCAAKSENSNRECSPWITEGTRLRLKCKHDVCTKCYERLFKPKEPALLIACDICGSINLMPSSDQLEEALIFENSDAVNGFTVEVMVTYNDGKNLWWITRCSSVAEQQRLLKALQYNIFDVFCLLPNYTDMYFWKSPTFPNFS